MMWSGRGGAVWCGAEAAEAGHGEGQRPGVSMSEKEQNCGGRCEPDGVVLPGFAISRPMCEIVPMCAVCWLCLG